MIVLTMKDRIRLKMGKVEFILKPLTVLEQSRVNSHRETVDGIEVIDVFKTAFSYIKHALKGIKGVKTYSKKDFELEFEGDYLSDDCASAIFNLQLGPEFYHALTKLKNNDVSKPSYVDTGKPLKGVKLEVIPAEGAEK